MQATRKAKLESLIKEELSCIVPKLVKDPRVPPVTFTQVELSADGGQVTVFVSIFSALLTQNSDEKSTQDSLQMESCLDGLNSASGYLRKQLSKTIKIRHIPHLIFRADRGLENTVRVHELLKMISEKKPC